MKISMGIGDWGLGIANPQSPIPKYIIKIQLIFNKYILESL